MNRLWLLLIAFLACSNFVFYVLIGPPFSVPPFQAVVGIAVFEIAILVIGTFASLAFAPAEAMTLWTTLGLIGATGLGLLLAALELTPLLVILFVVVSLLVAYVNGNYEQGASVRLQLGRMSYFLALMAGTFWMVNSLSAAPYSPRSVAIIVAVCGVGALVIGWRFRRIRNNYPKQRSRCHRR